ncbi:hypothetical protein F5Y09DRAFT_130776 [Xylaria sp. FL1042]|nr:hypothetical protein F5Y09DRAFT_130776 [Xylaria sp. FL1042]
MKTSVVLAAISAGFVVADLLPPPDNFPACGTTCFGNMLGQASQLGCNSGGSSQDAVDGACLCKNVDFSYGIIDCANAVCPDGVASQVIQYGINWCGEKGIYISGLSATPDPSIASSPTYTLSAASTNGAGSTGSGTSASTGSNIGGSSSTALSNGETATSGVEIPISTTEIVSTLTNSDGAVVTTTIATSTIFSTSSAESGSGTGSATGSGSASESTLFTQSTNTASGSTEITSAATGESGTGSTPTSTDSDGAAWQTAAPVGLVAAAAGLAALMM